MAFRNQRGLQPGNVIRQCLYLFVSQGFGDLVHHAVRAVAALTATPMGELGAQISLVLPADHRVGRDIGRLTFAVGAMTAHAGRDTPARIAFQEQVLRDRIVSLAVSLHLVLAGKIGGDIDQLGIADGLGHRTHDLVGARPGLEIAQLLGDIRGILPGKIGNQVFHTETDFAVAALAKVGRDLAGDRVAASHALLDRCRTITGIGSRAGAQQGGQQTGQEVDLNSDHDDVCLFR